MEPAWIAGYAASPDLILDAKALALLKRAYVEIIAPAARRWKVNGPPEPPG
jgi:hypothetical protein